MRVVPLLLLSLLPTLAGAQGVVYKCPGPPVLYTDNLRPDEAAAKGCTALQNAPVSVVQTPRRAVPVAAPREAASDAPRIDRDTQRARDSDRRAVLGAELRDAEAKLAALRTEFNKGEPERRGDERNYAKYQQRVEEMRAALTRQEADVAALRRELAKLPSPP